MAGIFLAALLPGFSQDLITCGWDTIRALRITGTNATTLWTWAATNSNLPEAYQPLFATTDECKPCPGGRVLVTSSGGDPLNGAVALIDPKSSNVLFYARAGNPHSAELLPGNRVVVAMSYQTNGNRLAVFDLSQPDVELFSTYLPAAHGVIWDGQRQVLWALSDSYLREYQLQDWDSQPQLFAVSTTPLPSVTGHDMYPIPNSSGMTVSTDLGCYIFDRDTKTFALHPLLGDLKGVKSICVHPTTGRIAYVQAEISWWSEHLRFVAPTQALYYPGEHFYKARWIPPEVPSLSIVLTSTNTVVVSWPSAFSGFTLQQSSNPSSTNWVEPAEPVQEAGANRFIIQDLTNEQQFYRLFQPSGN